MCLDYFIWTSLNFARISPTVDLVLISHGDLAHCGLYPWAHSRWGLKAPAYATLPVQAMGRIAVTEDVEGLRDEEDFGDETTEKINDEYEDGGQRPPSDKDQKGKCIPTVIEVQDAFSSMNTLRYSQPTHLQGKPFISMNNFLHSYKHMLQENVTRLVVPYGRFGHLPLVLSFTPST
jgi:Cft2 family RNA processing exonuclease